MTEEHADTLKGLQDLDLALEKARIRILEFDPLLAEVEEPALALEKEVETLHARVKEMKFEERRLERSADDRRSRVRNLQERLRSVRTMREEAAVQAESDILRRALETDEQEALTLLDQIRKMELRLDELEADLEKAKAEVEPKRAKLLEEQKTVRAEVARLEQQRTVLADQLPGEALNDYDRIRGGGRPVAIASLTPDGACGHCFSLVPLQVQNEIKQGGVLVPCEACGVLLSSEGVAS